MNWSRVIVPTLRSVVLVVVALGVALAAAACNTTPPPTLAIAISATPSPTATLPPSAKPATATPILRNYPTPTPASFSALPDTSVPPQAIRIVTSWNGPRLQFDTRTVLSDLRASDPQAAITPDGVVHLVWQQESGDVPGQITSQILYRSFSNGQWSPAKVIPKAAGAVRLAADGLGQLHLIWAFAQPGAGYRGGPSRVFYSRLPKGGSWTDPQELTDLVQMDAPPRAIVVGQDGTLHVAWDHVPWANDETVWYSQRRPDGTWLPREQVNQPPADHSLRGGGFGSPWPTMVANNDGTVSLAWGGNISSRGNLYFARRSTAGVWSSPQVIFRFEGDIVYPLLSPVADGSLALLLSIRWDESQMFPGRQEGVARSEMFLMFRGPDGEWSIPETVPNTGSDGQFPALAADRSGRVYMVWSSHFPSTGAFSAVRLPGGVGWGLADSLPAEPNEAMLERSLLITGDGQLLLVATTVAEREHGITHIVAYNGHQFPAQYPPPSRR